MNNEHPPCECGSKLAGWHGPYDGMRIYCCQRCWRWEKSNNRDLRDD